jgi:hypothetical protein
MFRHGASGGIVVTVTVIIVLVVLAALAAAFFFGPATWRASAAGTVGGLSTRVGKFIESGRGDPRTAGVRGGIAATPAPPRFTDADRAYLDGVWKHVQSTFVSDPRVAVTLARKTAEGFFSAHGVSTDGLPAGPEEAGDAGAAEDTEALRLKLLAIKTWSDREAAR